MLVQEYLTRSALRHPEKVCLVTGDHRLTYTDLDRITNRLANALLAFGLERGDRIGIWLPNSAAAVFGIFATLKAGCTFVMVNPTTKINKTAYILKDCGARLLITDEKKSKQAGHLLTQVPSLANCLLSGNSATRETLDMAQSGQPGFPELEALLTEYPEHNPAVRGIDLDLACIIYTSGSTGEPKGVMSDHSNVDFVSSSIIKYLGNDDRDIVLNVLPLSFDYGLYQLLMVFKFGGTLVLEKSFAYPAYILERMADERVTGLPGVPTIFSVLLQMDLEAYDLSSLRYITNTAAALPVSHIESLVHKFPSAQIFSMYGLTETKRTLYLPPDQIKTRPASVGLAIPGTEVWIEGESGNRLGPEEVGELVVRGRHVMRGYWNDPRATELRFKPGVIPAERVCYTGDLFRMDSEGYFYFVGRKDDIIKSRGEKVSPREVENVLYLLDGVVEAAVIGVPDPTLGQLVKAFVVSNNPAITEIRILAHCRDHLEDFMVPRQIEFRDSLPKTNTGKIKKSTLH